MKIKLLFLVLVLTASKSAFSAYQCTGKIDGINQAYEGSVSLYSSSIYGDSTGRLICNLNVEWKSVSPETCKGWLSKLLSHKAMSEEITIQYADAYSSCSEQPVWGGASHPWAFW